MQRNNKKPPSTSSRCVPKPSTVNTAVASTSSIRPTAISPMRRSVSKRSTSRPTGSAHMSTAAVPATPRPLSGTLAEIERLRESREQRRSDIEATRLELQSLRDKDPGNPNWEIAHMIGEHREKLKVSPPVLKLEPLMMMADDHIIVCARKRPLNQREKALKDVDVISVQGAHTVTMHQPRYKVDLTKYLEHHNFAFDFAFDDDISNELIYQYTCVPLVRNAFDGGKATCFAYGQTGSGKTFIMSGGRGADNRVHTGIYAQAAQDFFRELQKPERMAQQMTAHCSFFEIYGLKVYDLIALHKPELKMVEDGSQTIQLLGLTETAVSSVEEVLKLISVGERQRMCGQTAANSTSSRSHSIFQIKLRRGDAMELHGMCSFIDLAGNERGADNAAQDKATRLESADINKSLLALKECIRSLTRQSPHLPFRDSKLTQILRDSFIGGQQNRTCMIAMLSPGHSSCDHTLNTLRYAEAVKGLNCKGRKGQ